MSQRLSDYLTQETTDYLDQLDRLLAAAGRVDPAELLRLARGVRGSAQMAGLETISSVAERLEDAARSVASNTIAWSDEVRQLTVQTVRDLQILVRALNRWGPDEEARVRAAIGRWDEIDPSERAAVVPISTLFFDDAGPHVLNEAATASDDDVVPVGTLLLGGEEALREALRLRGEIEALAAQAGSPELLDRLHDLFGLIELGLPGGSHPPA